MKEQMRVWYEPDTDGTGELFVVVSASGFAGVGSAWFESARLLEFAARLLQAYPMPAQDPSLELRSGYLSKTDYATLEQEHVALKFYPIGALGTLGCQVRLSTPVAEFERPSQQRSVRVELVTTYEQVGQFARSLGAVVEGRASEATLEVHGT